MKSKLLILLLVCLNSGLVFGAPKVHVEVDIDKNFTKREYIVSSVATTSFRSRNMDIIPSLFNLKKEMILKVLGTGTKRIDLETNRFQTNALLGQKFAYNAEVEVFEQSSNYQSYRTNMTNIDKYFENFYLDINFEQVGSNIEVELKMEVEIREDYFTALTSIPFTGFVVKQYVSDNLKDIAKNLDLVL